MPTLQSLGVQNEKALIGRFNLLPGYGRYCICSYNRTSRTGQTTCYNAGGTEIDCACTGQDGATQVGVELPVPRSLPITMV